MAHKKSHNLARQMERAWREAERIIVAYLKKHRHRVVDESSGRTVTSYKIENIRDFYYAVTCLKRIHEGRQAALTLEVKHGDDQENNGAALDVLQKEISRVLENVQENGNGQASVEDSMPD